MQIKKLRIGTDNYAEGKFIVYTVGEWKAEAKRMFGEDPAKWQFICPSCGNIQCAEDFRKFKDQGATPEDAYYNCIGRFIDITKSAFGHNKPCNYSLGGLFTISNTVVIDDKGKERQVFDFARKCVTCGKLVGMFKDQVSLDEYQISRMCQECQDFTFNGPPKVEGET